MSPGSHSAPDIYGSRRIFCHHFSRGWNFPPADILLSGSTPNPHGSPSHDPPQVTNWRLVRGAGTAYLVRWLSCSYNPVEPGPQNPALPPRLFILGMRADSFTIRPFAYRAPIASGHFRPICGRHNAAHGPPEILLSGDRIACLASSRTPSSFGADNDRIYVLAPNAVGRDPILAAPLRGARSLWLAELLGRQPFTLFIGCGVGGGSRLRRRLV